MVIGERDRRARIGFGVTNVIVGVAIAVGVFRFLPTRWWVVDSGAALMTLLFVGSGVTLLRSLPIAELLTRVAAGIVLALGMALVTVLFATAGWISGVYNQVGTGGAMIFSLFGALLLPYVVVLPAAELAWLGPRAKRAPTATPTVPAAPVRADEDT